MIRNIHILNFFKQLLVYTDVCPSCGHLVAEHEYTFRVEGQYQVIGAKLSFLQEF